MKHLLFTPDRNSDDRSDYTGAFKPEGDRYAAFWRTQGDTVDVYRIDVSARSSARVEQVVARLDPAQPLDRLVFLCHGWHTGVQFGLKSDTDDRRARLAAFAAKLVAASTDNLAVTLYCCSTGASDDGPQGDGGFADVLRDMLCAAGRARVRVFAHTTAGHTTRNARVRYFLGDGSPTGAIGGVDPVTRGTPEYRRLDARFDDRADTLRFRVPYLTTEELLAELRAT